MSAFRGASILGAILLGVVLCSGCAAPQATPRLSVDAQAEALSRFSLGLMAENAGDFEIALRHFKEAIEIDPAGTVLYTPAVAAAMKLGQTDEALRLTRQLRKHQPGILPPLLLEAQVCALTGQTEEAEALFRKAALEFPEQTDNVIALARFLISQKKKPEAIETLEHARATHPEQFDILYLLGTLYVNRAQDLTDQTEMRDTILEGIDLLEKALALNPENPQQWQQLGYACLAVKEIEKARTAFEKSYERFPEDIQTARQLLDIYLLNGEIEHALAFCSDLSRNTGTKPELWLQYLTEKLPEEHRDELANHLESYLNEHPRAPVFYYAQLGSLYLDLEMLPEAESILNKAQKFYPDNDRVRTVLGYLNLQQERYEEAYTTFDRVRTNSPNSEWVSNPFFTFNLMVAAQKSGRIEEAAEALAASYTNDPAILNSYMQALLTGQTPVSTQSAIDLLKRFRTLSPEASEPLYYLSLLQTSQKKYEEALNNAQQFEALASSGTNTTLLNGFFYYQYGILYERTGQFNEAETFFHKAIDLGNPATVAAAQNYIAYMWAERGEKLEMCLTLIQKALAAEPDNAAFLDTLGWVYYMQGCYQEALDQLKRASELMGDDPVVWEHLGDTYLRLGDLQAAVKQWKKGLQIQPDQEQLIQRLEQNGISPDRCPVPKDTPADTPHHP